MPSNTTLNPGTLGDGIVTKQRTHDGDTVKQQAVTLSGVTGTEDAYTFEDINGSAANGLEVDVTRVQGTVTVDGSGVTQPVSGTVTANLSATDNAVLDTIAASNAAIQTAVEILDNAISGNEMQVDIVSGGTGSTQYAEDTVHNSGDTGTMALGVRNDTLASLVGADGDYAPLQVNANGSLYVEVENLGGTSNVDTASTGTDSGAVMLAIRDDALTTLTPVDGDFVHLRTNSTGALHVTGGGGGTEYTEDDAAPTNPIGSAGLMERDDALGGITPIEGDWSHSFCNANGALWTAIDGTVTVGAHDVTNAGTFAVQATLDAETTKVIGTVNVAAAQTIATTNAGTFVVQEDGAALTALQLIDNPIVAHDAAVSGSTGVNMLGLSALSADQTAVATADATRAVGSLLGKQVVMPHSLPGESWTYASPAAVTDTADDAAQAAGGAGIRHYITGVQVFNGHDTVGTEVVIKDGSTVLWRGWAEQTGGGCSATFPVPLRGTANTAVNVANITTGSSTYFNLQGYSAAE